jgi:F0F1-type ATP synthase membrane subunit c/vacuolar-type H+-ATPase subunit K
VLVYYFTAVVSAAGATVVSATATVVSTATAVESVATSVEALPPHATKVVAIAKIAITFFIFLLFCLNYTLFDITLISIGEIKKIGGPAGLN